eukprot:COSAG05_NODE_12052_length_485_cov_1.067358_1_plen_49_part_01
MTSKRSKLFRYFWNSLISTAIASYDMEITNRKRLFSSPCPPGNVVAVAG